GRTPATPSLTASQEVDHPAAPRVQTCLAQVGEDRGVGAARPHRAYPSGQGGEASPALGGRCGERLAVALPGLPGRLDPLHGRHRPRRRRGPGRGRPPRRAPGPAAPGGGPRHTPTARGATPPTTGPARAAPRASHRKPDALNREYE